MRISVFPFALVAVPILTDAAEEPDHEVLRKLENNIEIRLYASYVVAKMLVEGIADTARVMTPFRFSQATASEKQG
ncbi:hypothetical protein [Accumulibacter sp.]|uniref:hypothetical protein n=1 Tax=Accumulibacter sp. TaxID=2053492 RepID=UPI0028C4E876|nr:hypothetical protein [Accumulibacter sp.]